MRPNRMGGTAVRQIARIAKSRKAGKGSQEGFGELPVDDESNIKKPRVRKIVS